jgi:hypothetical protein
MPLKQASTLAQRTDSCISILGVLTNELLATSPNDHDVYRDRVGINVEGDQDIHIVEEVETLPEDEVQQNVTVFHRDENGIFLWPYQIQGFFKSAGEAMRQTNSDEKIPGGKGTKWGSIKSKIDKFLIVRPERIYLFREGDDGEDVMITEPDGICSRPLRAMTARGERISISRSELIKPGARFRAYIDILEGAPITEQMLVQMLAYGERVGLLQWRNSGKGRFVAFIDAPDGWVPSDKVRSKAQA